MKIHFLLAFIFMAILNVIGVYYVNVLFFGFFILIGIYSIIATQKIKISSLLWHTFLLVLFSLLIKILINSVFNYETRTPEGATVPLWAILMAGLMTLIVSEVISLLIGGLVIFLKRGKLVHK
ncbi:MAG: hypothetical protein WAL29_10750 [Bacteroidales bacterium]